MRRVHGYLVKKYCVNSPSRGGGVCTSGGPSPVLFSLELARIKSLFLRRSKEIGAKRWIYLNPMNIETSEKLKEYITTIFVFPAVTKIARKGHAELKKMVVNGGTVTRGR